MNISTAMPIFIGALVFAVSCWLFRRSRAWIMPSDTFFIMAVITAGIAPLLNLYARAPIGIGYPYSDQTVARALLALAMMFAVIGCFWLFRPRLSRVARAEDFLAGGSDASRLDKFLLGLTVLAFLLGVASLAYPPYLEFKISGLRFLSGQLAGEEYQLARRITAANDPFIGGVIGRLRYSLFAFLYIAACLWSFKRWGVAGGLPTALALFLLLGMSMSKAPIFFYCAYAGLAYIAASQRTKLLKFRYFLGSLGGAVIALLIILVLSYYRQYPQAFNGLEDLGTVLDLAFYRTFLATYDGLLAFFTVYPAVFEYAGWSSFSLYNLFTGIDGRVLDVEVPSYLHGRGTLTTYPTIYVGNAYASFGYLGVVLYSIVVCAVLAAADWVVAAVKSRSLRAVAYAGLLVNIVFLAQLSMPTALATYGIVLIGACSLIADRLLRVTGPTWGSDSSREPSQSIGQTPTRVRGTHPRRS